MPFLSRLLAVLVSIAAIGLAAMQVPQHFEFEVNDLLFGIGSVVICGLLTLQIAFILKDFGG